MEDQLREMKERELNVRREFARVFGLYSQKDSYTRDQTLREPSWSEIFFELGKLFAEKNSVGTLHDLDSRVRGIETKLMSDDNPDQIHIECVDPHCIFSKL